MTARVETVISVLLSDPPRVLEAPALLRGLDLIPNRVPAWITDEAVRQSILDGFLDIPDDLLPEAARCPSAVPPPWTPSRACSSPPSPSSGAATSGGTVSDIKLADLTGSVRLSPTGKSLAVLWPSPPHPDRWIVTDQWGSTGYESDERVADWTVVGAVPYSPAAGMALDGSAKAGASDGR